MSLPNSLCIHMNRKLSFFVHSLIKTTNSFCSSAVVRGVRAREALTQEATLISENVGLCWWLNIWEKDFQSEILHGNPLTRNKDTRRHTQKYVTIYKQNIKSTTPNRGIHFLSIRVFYVWYHIFLLWSYKPIMPTCTQSWQQIQFPLFFSHR